MTAAPRSLVLAGCEIDLRGFDEAVTLIANRATHPGGVPLAVVSVNLDHVHHFGLNGRWFGALDHPSEAEHSIEWLNLIDGAPLAAEAARRTGVPWPRLAGSDLIGPLIEAAERDGVSVGFLGGDPRTQELLREILAVQHPTLRVSGFWAPSREELGDRESSSRIAAEIAAAGTDVLVVGLGKPRQELWIARYGAATGARVLLAFGAVVDFLAGRIDRAPSWVVRAGMEWGWRLTREPRRLAQRYLVNGPPAYLAVRRTTETSEVRPARIEGAQLAAAVPASVSSAPRSPGDFAEAQEQADVAVIVVTFNNADDVASLVASLRRESHDLRLRVVLADNGSTDATVALLRAEPGIVLVETGGNLGYAGGINAAMKRVGNARSVLILNPDLVVERGAIAALFARLLESSAGAAVPQMLETDGTIYPSLRREPTVRRALGDALLGSRFGGRPAWSSELDSDAESYRHPHRIEWATGAAILIARSVADEVGRWDARFFLYSEETDYLRRIRERGYTVWFEPEARVRHERGGSGASPALDALMAVNRIRYARKHLSKPRAVATHVAALLHESMRSYDAVHRSTLRVLLDQRSWRRLPRATRWPVLSSRGGAIGAIVIPAHNEAAVISRTLSTLAELAAAGTVEVIVVCNGCTDDTATVARSFAGVRVIEIETPSKVAALNVGDSATEVWPRLYLDADIQIHPGAVASVFEAVAGAEPAAARPAFRYDSAGASALVRAYYRARDRMPSTRSALWGAGAYAVNQAGHDRFGEFPEVTADDLFVDEQFDASEKTMVECEPVRVRTPRTVASLLAVLTRQRRGNVEGARPAGSASTARELARTVRGPLTLVDAVAYLSLTLIGRKRARAADPSSAWERDESSRVV